MIRKNDINIFTNYVFTNYKYKKLVEYRYDHNTNYLTIFKFSKILEYK